MSIPGFLCLTFFFPKEGVTGHEKMLLFWSLKSAPLTYIFIVAGDLARYLGLKFCIAMDTIEIVKDYGRLFMIAEYKVLYSFDKETGQVCAEVPALNHLSDFGNDFKEAEKNITKAVELYLKHLHARSQKLPQERARKGTFIRLSLSPALAK